MSLTLDRDLRLVNFPLQILAVMGLFLAICFCQVHRRCEDDPGAWESSLQAMNTRCILLL
jgi:hypothetical protein